MRKISRAAVDFDIGFYFCFEDKEEFCRHEQIENIMDFARNYVDSGQKHSDNIAYVNE